MKEDFIHYIWKYKLFDFSSLKTEQGSVLELKNVGTHNSQEGPDFLNAQICINKQLWAGNVEIHVKSSDWYLHQHETDSNYDAVILHVVWEHDTDVFNKNDEAIETLVLSSYVSDNTLNNYKELLHSKERWIPCETHLKTVDSFVVKNWLERLYFERLENKANLVSQLLQSSQNNWEFVCFQLICKGFGLKINGDAFLQFSKSIPFHIIRKVQSNELQLSALFFGQAGFLDETIENGYYQALQKEYNYLKHKFSLQGVHKKTFQFFRNRPNNFPTVRLAQLIAVYFNNMNVFQNIIAAKSVADVKTIFNYSVTDFWQEHYTFSNKSKKSSKKPTNNFISLLIINTILPLQFCYEQSLNKMDKTDYLKIISSLSSEKNSIIEQFSILGITANSALESQALLELKNNYCAKKQCLQCAIGNNLLKK